MRRDGDLIGFGVVAGWLLGIPDCGDPSSDFEIIWQSSLQFLNEQSPGSRQHNIAEFATDLMSKDLVNDSIVETVKKHALPIGGKDKRNE